MRTTLLPVTAALLLAGAGSALAEVRYVDVNSTNATPPYTNWATAATKIQDAVDAAVAGDEIVVTNGIYATGGRAAGSDSAGNRVAVDRPLSLRSVNGPQATVIVGPGRCVYLANGASLSGFTLKNGGAPRGGGLWCESTNAVVYNCVIAGNSAIYGTGGGAYQGTLNNCTLSGNWAYGPIRGAGGLASGGGAASCMLNNCTLTGNVAWGGYIGYGSGAAGCTLNNCIVYFNNAVLGANCYASTLNYCCTTPLPTDALGNITKEPAFVNLYAGNFHLRPDSPCIDAGTNLSVIITNDLDGRPRPLDGNGDGIAAFDMGAYEYRTPLLVWQGSLNPTSSYTTWTTAATNIQDAMDAALAGDEIVVTNGLYATGGRVTSADGTSNRVAVDKPLNVRSINGPQFTTIDGGHSNRCVYLTNSATLSGFTLTNGVAENGGGVFCESTNALVSNCVLAGNSANSGGGAYGGTLNECALSGNSAWGPPSAYGGGAYNSMLNNCTLSGNHAYVIRSGGGSACGGGVAGCTLNNCLLTGNSAVGQNGCNGGSGGAAYACSLNNCTLTGNSVFGECHNSFGGGAAYCALNNCIVYFNTNNSPIAFGGANYDGGPMNHCCTTPDPGGIGNITNAPLFVDQASGNLRLQSNSPCINAGLNAPAPACPDLDGNPRIAGGTVDIGAYEFQSPASMISYAWLQQFNLPINPATDAADPDDDGVDNYHEWLASTDPTNPLSSPAQLTIIPSGTNIGLSWSTNAVGFTLQSITNLFSPAVWNTISPPPVLIGGQNVVTNPITGPQQFYRLSR